LFVQLLHYDPTNHSLLWCCAPPIAAIATASEVTPRCQSCHHRCHPSRRYEGNIEQNHKGVARALFDDAVDINNIPCLHICPMKQEPPMIDVYFDIPNVDGTLSNQVFERLELYRWIATPGTVRTRREVSHPINQQWVFRPSAWALVCRVSNDHQLLLQRERVALGITPQDESPLSQEDTDLFEKTMRMANDRRFGSI
jgi:hypothetical protein